MTVAERLNENPAVLRLKTTPWREEGRGGRREGGGREGVRSEGGRREGGGSEEGGGREGRGRKEREGGREEREGGRKEREGGREESERERKQERPMNTLAGYTVHGISGLGMRLADMKRSVHVSGSGCGYL